MKMNTELIDRYNMLPPGTRVLCALSGGADSVCLLGLLLELAEERDISVAAAHFEHGIRGEESLRDARFCRELCREKGVEFICESGSVPRYAEENNMGTEEAARELRYDFLRRAAQKLHCDKIATAHNCDDNAETMLFNLSRGSGAAGLRGIPPVRGNIIRPLLGCTREDIEAYLREKGLPHVEDSTNSADDYSRNLIRHRVMPVLRQLNPSAAASALRTAELMRQDEDCLSLLTEEFIRKNFDGESISAAALAELPGALSSRVIRRLCPQTLSRSHVEAVLALLPGDGLAYLDLPGIRLRRQQGRLWFSSEAEEEIRQRELKIGEELSVPEAGIRIKSTVTVKNREINDLFKTYFFKYENICGKILLTGRRPGDKISPLGRNCTKSLKKLFTEAGYTQEQKRRAPVLRDDKGVLAVLGLAADRRTGARYGEKTLRIEIEKMQGDGK